MIHFLDLLPNGQGNSKIQIYFQPEKLVVIYRLFVYFDSALFRWIQKKQSIELDSRVNLLGHFPQMCDLLIKGIGIKLQPK